MHANNVVVFVLLSKYESFVNDKYDHPTYTRPEVYKGFKVPDVLLSGDHKKIDEWKKNNLKDI